MTGDIFSSLRCDCQDQLHRAMAMMEEEGKGARKVTKQEKVKKHKLTIDTTKTGPSPVWEEVLAVKDSYKTDRPIYEITILRTDNQENLESKDEQ